MNLEEALKSASYKIWDEMEPVIDNKDFHVHQVSEPGLTSMALKKIVNSGCKQILWAKMIPGSQENEEGYDFELCIGSKKKSKWVRYFIQAKRQTGYKLNGRYKAIEKSQLDTLKSWAKKNKGIPLCALYKNLQLNNGDLYEYYNSITEFNKRAMGITLAIPDSFLKGNDFNTLHIFDDNFLRIFHRYRYNPKRLAFYNHNVNTAVPFHELAYFTIEFAEAYNEEYKKQNAKNILSFFFFFGFSNSFLYGDGDNLIPIINSSPDELIKDFDRRLISKDAPFNSSAILILDTFEE